MSSQLIVTQFLISIYIYLHDVRLIGVVCVIVGRMAGAGLLPHCPLQGTGPTLQAQQFR